MSSSSPNFEPRNALEGVSEWFVTRWSPRRYNGKAIPTSDLAVMFDAARWSPSCYNEQPWRFYTSTAQTRDAYLATLVDANQQWAASAPVLGFVVAKKQFDRNGEPNALASFDTGAAWMAFNLQASLMGYHVHGMAGVHYDAAYSVLGLDADQYELVCAFAVGTVDEADGETVSVRKPLHDIWLVPDVVE